MDGFQKEGRGKQMEEKARITDEGGDRDNRWKGRIENRWKRENRTGGKG